jgi:hypothetical protein
VNSGNYRYTFTYIDGGVDFGDVPFATVPQPAFQQQYSDVSTAVGQSFQKAAPDQHSEVWLGATAQVKPRTLDFTTGDDGLLDDAPPPLAELDASTLLGRAIQRIAITLGALLVIAVALLVFVKVSRRRKRGLRA